MKFTACARCSKPFTNTREQIDTWAVTATDGVMTGIVCPGCQTAEEHVEAATRAALDNPETTVEISSVAIEDIYLEAIRVASIAATDHDRGVVAGLRYALERLGVRFDDEETP